MKFNKNKINSIIKLFLVLALIYFVIGFINAFYWSYFGDRLFNCDDTGGCVTIIQSVINIITNKGNDWILILFWPIVLYSAIRHIYFGPYLY